MSQRSVAKFVGQCLRKKRMRECHADSVIKRAAKGGTKLFKYFCPYCSGWHVTKQPQ